MFQKRSFSILSRSSSRHCQGFTLGGFAIKLAVLGLGVSFAPGIMSMNAQNAQDAELRKTIQAVSRSQVDFHRYNLQFANNFNALRAQVNLEHQNFPVIQVANTGNSATVYSQGIPGKATKAYASRVEYDPTQSPAYRSILCVSTEPATEMAVPLSTDECTAGEKVH